MITRLSPHHRDLLIEHFSAKSLSPSDIRVRFGREIDLHTLTTYVSSLDFDKEYLIADIDTSMTDPCLDGFGHLIIPKDPAQLPELGVSWLKCRPGAAAQICEVASALLYEYNPSQPPRFLMLASSAHLLLKHFPGAKVKKVKSSGVPKVRHAGTEWVEMLEIELPKTPNYLV